MEKLTREITASHPAVKISLFDFNNIIVYLRDVIDGH
jgi:hypothetical protein